MVSSIVPTKLRNLPLINNWGLWITHNMLIFQNATPHWPFIVICILSDYSIIPDDDETARPRSIVPETFNHLKPWAFFDGSAQEGGCGGRAILYLINSHYYYIQMGLGWHMNNFVELSTAKFLI